jgi:cytidylate kinase
MNTAIIVCGSPGAGKSTYGSKLAAERRALLLDIDTCTEQIIRASLAELGLDTDDRDSDYFKSTFREPIYETLFNINPVSLSFDKNSMTLERARSWSFAPSRAAVKIYPAPIMTRSDL